MLPFLLISPAMQCLGIPFTLFFWSTKFLEVFHEEITKKFVKELCCVVGVWRG
jgi:chemotaxis methyl-accepting protein methylase